MLIQNEWDEVGTGFLISKPDLPGGKIGRVFLVTNKHVLNRKPSLRNSATQVILDLNVRDASNNIKAKSLVFHTGIDDKKTYNEHPSADVDVLVFEITELLITNPEIAYQALPIELIATKEVIQIQDIKIGEEVVVVGYPIGLKHRDTNFPLVRRGIISTNIGEPLEDYVKDKGKIRKRTIRGFFIDGAVIPGSSGSPVIVNPLTLRFIGERMAVQSNNLLLGIIAETFYAPIKLPRKQTYGFAGIGLAFDGETILETIDLFG